MKPARFILNSDYTTVRNTGEITLSVTIPDSITTPPSEDDYIIGETSASIGNRTDAFMIYFTSSAFPYSTPGRGGATKPNGATTTYVTDEIYFNVIIRGDTATLRVRCQRYDDQPTTWTGYGQTITAHILTFKDPFSE